MASFITWEKKKLMILIEEQLTASVIGKRNGGPQKSDFENDLREKQTKDLNKHLGRNYI
jgi:hypothetical protein